MSDEKRKKSLTIEEAMARIELIVRQLEEGKLPLEESIKVFSEGMSLIDWCQKKLDEVQAKVQKILREDSGRSWKTEPFKEDEGE
ncbi:MAG: exodeoxyribonuclease VII small subunit [Syntrophobacterales bacterium]|nr:exodeoxyribonuclease VII small subunit [Syntrophobacterales bacterium]